MPDRYGDYRDKQRRFMHRPAPHLEAGYESRLFADGEVHDTAQGWTHYPHDAIERGKAPQKPRREPQAAEVQPVADDEEISLEAQLAALKRPALLKMASDLGVPYDMGWTAAQLREAILNRE